MLNRLAVAAIMLLAVLTGAAQGMKVLEFKQLTSDQTARSRATERLSKLDGDKRAGLVKIVTREKGFKFEGGQFSAIVGEPVQRTGEIWLYLRPRTQKFTITHDRYGVLRDYQLPLPIESGSTYEMTLDPGIGRYVMLQATMPGTSIWVDGDSLGLAPINDYFTFGKHHVTARNTERFEGEMTIDIPSDGKTDLLPFTVEMIDQSTHFGILTVQTESDAEIWFEGKLRGKGLWATEMREGNYSVETRRVNADPQRTSFTVQPRQTNIVQATPPTAHMGYISLLTRPQDAAVTVDGRQVTDVANIVLPVGEHEVSFSRQGYYPLSRTYTVGHNTTLPDTINLERVQYLKAAGFYLGAAYTVGTWSGPTVMVGGTFLNIDLQASYMLGLSKSKSVNYYSNDGSTWLGSAAYSLSTLSVKAGYQIRLMTRFGIVPQLGYSAHMLSAKDKTGSVPSSDTSAACATVGAKLIYSPLQHFCITVAPEYDIAVSKGRQFADIASSAGFSAGGFFCNLGIIVNF